MAAPRPTSSRPARRRPYYGWPLTLALGVVAIVGYGCTQYLFGVLVVPISQELGCSRGALSAVYSAGLLVAAVLGVPVGRLVDRHGARLAVAGGALLGAASLAGLSAAPSLRWVLVCWGGGIGAAMALTLYPVTFVVVANWFQARRAAAMALLTTVGGLSASIYIPLAGALTATFGWRHAVLALAATEAALAPLALLTIRRRPEDLGLAPDGRDAKNVPADADGPSGQPAVGARVGAAVGVAVGVGAALRRPAFWLLTVAGGAGMLAAAMLAVHQVPYLLSRGARPVDAASIAGLTGVASLPSRLALNVLCAKLRGAWLLALAFGAMAASAVVLARARDTAGFVGYALLYGAGFGAANALRATVMAEHFGRLAYGAITGAQNVAVLAASAVGPFAAGWLYDTRGDYTAAFAAVAVAALLASAASAATTLVPAPSDEGAMTHEPA